MKELSLQTHGRFSELPDWFSRFINEDFHFRTELIRTSDSYENCKERETRFNRTFRIWTRDRFAIVRENRERFERKNGGLWWQLVRAVRLIKISFFFPLGDTRLMRSACENLTGQYFPDEYARNNPLTLYSHVIQDISTAVFLSFLRYSCLSWSSMNLNKREQA